MKTPNGQCRKRCRLLKVTKTKKTLEKLAKTLENQKNKKKLGKTKKKIRESWLGPPPSKESRNIVFFCFLVFSMFFFFFWFSNVLASFSKVFLVSASFFKVFLVFPGFGKSFQGFSKVFPRCGVLQGNWHESQAKLSKCLWECSKTSVNHLKRSS